MSAQVGTTARNFPVTHHRTETIGGVKLFYREAGPKDGPAIVLLHGFPTSSHMFRNLIPALADKYHVIAPDYPGYGQSSMPSATEYDYTFDNLASVVDDLIQQLGVERYSLYLMDYGAPVGFRIAAKHPERVQSLIVQNGNAYEEGLREFWDPIKKYWSDPPPENRTALHFLVDPKATRWQYENGAPDASLIDPTTWLVDQVGLDRPGNR